jgi:hypothetical protein
VRKVERICLRAKPQGLPPVCVLPLFICINRPARTPLSVTLMWKQERWVGPMNIGLARTVYTHRIWPYVWWIPCQKYRIYTVYTYKCMVLDNPTYTPLCEINRLGMPIKTSIWMANSRMEQSMCAFTPLLSFPFQGGQPGLTDQVWAAYMEDRNSWCARIHLLYVVLFM